MTEFHPPRLLSKPAKAKWRAVANLLDELDAGAVLHVDIIAENWDLRREALRNIAEKGAVTLDRFKQEKPSPWVSIARDCALAIQRSYRSLGLDLAPEEK